MDQEEQYANILGIQRRNVGTTAGRPAGRGRQGGRCVAGDVVGKALQGQAQRVHRVHIAHTYCGVPGTPTQARSTGTSEDSPRR